MRYFGDSTLGYFGDITGVAIGTGHAFGDSTLGRFGDIYFSDPGAPPLLPPEITDISDFRLGSTLTITLAADITLPLVSIQAAGVALEDVTVVTATELTAAIGLGGYGPIGTQVEIVCTDSVGASTPVTATILVPDGYTTVQVATKFPAPWPAGNEVGDTCFYLPEVEYEGETYACEIASNGAIRFAEDAPAGISTLAFFQDASQEYRATSAQLVYALQLSASSDFVSRGLVRPAVFSCIRPAIR